MSTPDKDTVNAEAMAAQVALKDAANTAWEASADIVIAEVAARGKYSVTLPVLKPASMSDISEYYRALDYGVCFDQCDSWSGAAEWPGPFSYPYGAFFPSFYSFFFICNCKHQCHITISWR